MKKRDKLAKKRLARRGRKELASEKWWKGEHAWAWRQVKESKGAAWCGDVW